MKAHEQTALWRAARTAKRRLLYVLLCHWGLRASEAGHFNRSWIERGSAPATFVVPLHCGCLRCAASGRAWRHTPGRAASTMQRIERGEFTPKTDYGYRRIPYGRAPPELVRAIDDYLTDHEGLYVSRQAVWRLVKRWLVDAGMAYDRSFPHALRATAATRLADEGQDVFAIMGVLGWRNFNVASRYIRLGTGRFEGRVPRGE